MDSVIARLLMIQWSLDILSGSSCIIWQSRQIWKSCKSMVRWKLVLWSAVLQTQEPILGFRTQLAENRLLPATTKDTQTDQSEKAASSEQQPSDQVLGWQLLYVAHTFRNSKRSEEGTNTVGMATAPSYGLAFASPGIQALCVRSSTCCPEAASASMPWSIKERLAHPPDNRWLIYVQSWHAGCPDTAQPTQPSKDATTMEVVIAAPRSAPDALSPTPWEDTATWRLVLAQRHVR